jgi:glycosyltransferase involved in cell wall biosynthesis
MTAEDRPLRIAFFGHAQGRRRDGLSAYSHELVRSLRARGATVRFFAHREDGDEVPVEPGDAVWLRARHFKTVTIPTPGTMGTVRRALEDFRPDVVHISWSFSLHDGAIARAAHRVGAACVATFHLPHGPAGTTRGKVMHGLYRYHALRMGHIDRCITLSGEQRDLLVSAGYAADRTAVIANGVDTAAISPGPSSLRDELGARLVVLYVGRLDPEKRAPELVDTFLSLAYPDDHVLCLAGDGIQRDRLRKVAAGRRNVRVLGLVSPARKLELLRGCDVFVLPSTAEGLSLSLLEAMAAGCAVVATDAGEDGSALEGAGLVIPTHPLRPALDEALRRLIADPALRAQLGEAARARAAASFAFANTVDRVQGVYADAARSAAQARGAPTPAALP